MTVDYSKFPLTGIEEPHAATLTEAMIWRPVDNRYLIVTLKTGRGIEFASTVRLFATELRSEASSSGMT